MTCRTTFAALLTTFLLPTAIRVGAQEAGSQTPPSVPLVPAATPANSILEVALLSVAILAILASLVSLHRWMSRRGIVSDQGVFDYLAIYIAGFAAISLLVYHAAGVIESGSTSLLELLGEISVVLIVWFFFMRLHTVGKLTDEAKVLVHHMGDQTTAASQQLKTAQNELASAQVKLDSAINDVIAATGILNKESIDKLTARGEKSEWFQKLAEVRQATVNAYFAATPVDDSKRSLVRSTFFKYFDEVTNQLANQLLFATTLDVHANLVFELGTELSKLAKSRQATPVMCFGNVFAIDRFFNSNSEFNNDRPRLGPSVDFMDEYVEKLARLRRDHGVEQYRFTFVEDGDESGLEVLPSGTLGDQGSYYIFGDKSADGRFVPTRLRADEIKKAVRLGLFETAPHTDECYLILPYPRGFPVDPGKAAELHKLCPERMLLYEYFADRMHDGATDRCRVVSVSTDTATRLLPEFAAEKDIFARLSGIFPKVQRGYGSTRKNLPVADFVAFCLKSTSGATAGQLSAAVIIADRVDTQHDTVLLRLIHEHDDLVAVERLLRQLASDKTLKRLTDYSPVVAAG